MVSLVKFCLNFDFSAGLSKNKEAPTEAHLELPSSDICLPPNKSWKPGTLYGCKMPPKSNLRIVSFDGGAVRGLSQVEIMKSIMYMLNWDSKSNVSAEGMLPCERFDLMGGSGTGGLIAILFAKLRMSVEEVSEEFCTIIKQVYNTDGLVPSERTKRLRICMESIMERKGLPLDLQLTEKTQPACSAFVVASPRANTKSTLCLRTYPVRRQPPSEISVVDAAVATCATQPEFAPLSSGSGFKLREYIAAGGAANPIHSVITEAHLLFGGDSSVASLLSLGVGHPGIIALPSAGGEATLHRMMRDMMDDCEQRAQEMEERIGRVGVYSRFSVEQGMQNDHSRGPIDAAWILTQTEDYLARHETGEKLDLFAQIFGAHTGPITLDQLKHAGGPAASGQLAAAVEKLQGILISNQDDAIIAKLKPADLDSGSHAAGCMEGTRQDILARIDAWAANVDTPNILWLNGHPGVGKSAISSSLVENWRSSGRLGSSFFFRRERANFMTPNALWRTVAYDLGRRYPSIRKHLVTALNANETLPSTSNTNTLFRELIHETLLASEKIDGESLPIIVVDALDECGGVDGWHSDHRKALMRTLESWASLPGRFKLIVTSRAESDIERLFSTTAHHPIEVSAGQKVDPLSSMDIRMFLKHELQQIANHYPLLPSNWPGDQIVERLADRAAGLFIWVKTIVKLLERGEPVRTLNQILEGGGGGGMADLYTWILNVSFPNPSREDIRDFHSILGAIIFNKAPLDASSLAQLLSIETSTMGYVCNGLLSVLDSGNALRIHHQSFADFLLNPDECPPNFLIIRERDNRNLAVACLKVMNSHLRFNICELESSYLRNSEVPDLHTKIEKHIPSHLFYSSRFWVDHLAETTSDGELFECLQYFLQNQFLFWLEVLSLTGTVNVASSMLWTLLNWIRASHQDDPLAADMQKFVACFASVISQSVPHIYLSALPFSPRGIGVSKQYLALYPQTFGIKRGGQIRWPAIQIILSGHPGAVLSVAFSPDGRRIISGADDGMVRVWDAETGQAVLEPLKGHTSRVNSVSFSPDGRQMVSGSSDQSVRLWDSETGQTVLEPLKGHTSHVNSVSFSPDSRHIVSGAGDQSIRVWDARTGQVVLGPLKGYTGLFYSVSFSPDGSRIVSGSSDNSIRVWDAKTGLTVLPPLRGHGDWVRSASFSPDGRRIVSGSADRSVRVWDAETGQLVLGPLKGHTDFVHSVSFSPDGRRIVSGSSDNSVRVWDAKTGLTVLGPLTGHTGAVNSVSFSPDSRRIVSCSTDHSVRLWDAETDQTAFEPLRGHSDWVRSVSFSPNGQHIVSGSDDLSIRAWNAETGQTVLGPLKGHVGLVTSVSFSPDGRCIVSGSTDNYIRVWDAETGQTVLGPLEGHHNRIRSVAFSPDGRRIVSGSDDKSVRVWNAETGQTVLGPLKGHSGYVYSVTFSPDGRRIVSGSSDRSVRIWDAETGRLVLRPLKGHTGEVHAVSFSPDGRRIASGSNDQSIQLWDAQTGQMVLGPLEGHSGAIYSVCFSPDGRHVVSGSGDNSVRVWDAETGQAVLGPWKEHSNTVYSVSFSPDGRRIASGSSDRSVRVWEVEMGETAPLAGQNSVLAASFSPEGKRISSGSDDTKVRVRDTKATQPTGSAYSIFQNSPRTQDGWMLSPNSELLFWVPPELRPKLCPLRNTLVLGGDATILDLKHFVHGEAWSRCKVPL